MRGLHMGDLDRAVAIEIGDPGRVEPAMGKPDRIALRQRRDTSVLKAVDGERRAGIQIGADGDQFVFSIAIEVDQTRAQILEYGIVIEGEVGAVAVS